MTTLLWSRWRAHCHQCGRLAPAGAIAILPGRRAQCAQCWAWGAEAPICPDHPDLYGYQRDGVSALRATRAHLLADEPGLGKTAQALVALSSLPGPPPGIVVCPPSVRRQWRDEVRRWSPGLRPKVRESGRRWLVPHSGEVVVCGYTLLRHLDADVKVDPETVVILDEAQATKNPSAQQTRGARYLGDAAHAAGGRVWLLTATPALAEDREAWEVLRSAQLHRALHPIAARWQEAPPQQQARDLAAVMTRRRAVDQLDLPPLRWSSETVEVTAAAATQIEDAARRAAEEALGEEVPDVRAAVERLIEDGDELPLSTVRRLCAEAKLPRALELATEHAEAGSPLVALCDHRSPVLRLAEQDGWGAVVGGQTATQRADQVSAFLDHGTGLAVSYAAGGTGLDGLQRRASRALLIDLPWTPAVLEQALGRLVRIGQRGSVLATLLQADHWVDEILVRVAARKLTAVSELGTELGLAEGLREVA